MSASQIAWSAIGVMAVLALLADGACRLHRKLAPHRYMTHVEHHEFRGIFHASGPTLAPPRRLLDGDPNWIPPEKRPQTPPVTQKQPTARHKRFRLPSAQAREALAAQIDSIDDKRA